MSSYLSAQEIEEIKQVNAYRAADLLIEKSSEWSAKFVGREISSQQWLNLWNLECNVASACLAASKFGPESFRKSYAESAELHKAFARSAWEKAGKE